MVDLLGGDFNMYEINANIRAFKPVSPGGDWIIFKYNGTLGWVGSTDGTIVPYIHRYRAGGINSVRGYDWYTLGPSIRALGYQQEQGNSSSLFVGMDDPTAPDDRLVIGGTETWINNFELEEPIFRQAGLSTVLFFDAGNAFGDPWGNGHINPVDLRFAYGFGIRWLSPMGPLPIEKSNTTLRRTKTSARSCSTSRSAACSSPSHGLDPSSALRELDGHQLVREPRCASHADG